jgi:hypothetical protein
LLESKFTGVVEAAAVRSTHVIPASLQLYHALSDIAVLTKDTVHSNASRKVACVIAAVSPRHASTQDYLKAAEVLCRQNQFVHSGCVRQASRIAFAMVVASAQDHTVALRLPALMSSSCYSKLPLHQQQQLQAIQDQCGLYDSAREVQAVFLRSTTLPQPIPDYTKVWSVFGILMCCNQCMWFRSLCVI